MNGTNVPTNATVTESVENFLSKMAGKIVRLQEIYKNTIDFSILNEVGIAMYKARVRACLNYSVNNNDLCRVKRAHYQK